MKLLFPIVVKQACSCMKIILCGKRYGFFFSFFFFGNCSNFRENFSSLDNCFFSIKCVLYFL